MSLSQAISARSNDVVPALVLGSHLTGLGVVRLLAAHGIPAYSVATGKDAMTRSRWYRPAPAPLDETQDSQRLAAYLDSLPLRRAVLIPCSDIWVRAVAGLPPEMRERFPSSTPGRSIIEEFVDKDRFRALVARLDIPSPLCVSLNAEADLDAASDAAIVGGFLKPTDSLPFARRFGTKGFWVRDRDEARARLREVHDAGLGLMLQEWIPGPPRHNVHVDMFVDRTGRTTAALVRRRVRMEPPRLGNSASNVTIDPADGAEPLAVCRTIVESVGHRGIFSAEFKFDARDGRFKILEVNARPYWYIGFTAWSGVDLVEMTYRDALGLSLEPVTSYRLGAFGIYEINDALAICRSLLSLRRPDGPVLRPWLLGHHALYSWRDPLPALADASDVLLRRLRRRRA